MDCCPHTLLRRIRCATEKCAKTWPKGIAYLPRKRNADGDTEKAEKRSQLKETERSFSLS